MPNRQGEIADKGPQLLVTHRTLNENAANGIRPVADDDRYTRGRCLLETDRHRTEVGVITSTDVLQIHHQHVDTSKHFPSRSSQGTVERMQWYSSNLSGSDGLTISSRAAKTVFGRKNRRKRYFLHRMQCVE